MSPPRVAIKPIFKKGWEHDGKLVIKNLGSISSGFKAKDRELSEKGRESWVFPATYNLTPASESCCILDFLVGTVSKKPRKIWAVSKTVRPIGRYNQKPKN